MSQHDNSNDHEAGGLKGAMNKASDMVGGMVGMASAATAGSHSSQAFVMNACIGDLYEIEAGKIASQRAGSDSVRMFGQMMVEHHTTAMHQMQSALMSSEVTRDNPDLKPTRELDNRRQGMIKHLQEASAEDFDKTYIDQQRLAHQESVTLHKGYAESGDNPQLRSVALGGLPMVERHLKALERIGVH
jgi:putative membrane protein